MCCTFFLCNDLIPTLLSLGINLFKFKEIYLYTHVCVCVCVSIHMHGHTWRGRFAHHLSLEPGKAPGQFPFCSQCPSKARDLWGPVPTQLHAEERGRTQAESREKHPDATEHLPIVLSPREKASGHFSPSSFRFAPPFHGFWCSSAQPRRCFSPGHQESSRRSRVLSGKRMLPQFSAGISSSPAAV